jgi:hypothetical protein
MAILERGRWGIRRWTASPIGRLVTVDYIIKSRSDRSVSFWKNENLEDRKISAEI